MISVDIFEAIEKGRIKDVRYYLNRGVKINSIDDHGTRLVDLAFHLGQDEIVKFLLKRNAEVDSILSISIKRFFPQKFLMKYRPDILI